MPKADWQLMQSRILSNAIWNVVNGSSSAMVAIVVPPFLTRLLTPEAYGAWAVALQIGTYVGLFGFGLQMAVGRYVAYAEARGDMAQRDGIVSTAFWFLVLTSAVGWLAICGIGLSIERLLPHLSVALAGETRAAVILVGLALAINLPASIFAAVFTGQHRSDVPAKIQGLGRILLALGLILAGFSHSLAILGLVYAVISILTVAALWYAWRTRTAAPTLEKNHVSTTHGRELAGFCLSLTIWNFSMTLVSGLDLIIVGRWDYASTPYFAVSVTLTTMVAGTITSLANALVPAAASLSEDENGQSLRRLLAQGSRFVMAASIIAGLPLVFCGYTVLELWLGESYAEKAAPILAILVSAAMIRNALLPYVTLAIGTGDQRKLTLIPLTEGFVSIIASLVLVIQYGAYGVALAKLVGGFTGVTLLMIRHPLKISLGDWSRQDFFALCVLKPASAIIMVTLVATVVTLHLHDQLVFSFIVLSVTAILAVYFLTLSKTDRMLVRQFTKTRLTRKTFV
jgi:O-antigen/teichoic acid export membrane protein